MAWVIAIGGIIMLIVLHEAGHFVAAKAVGMRVERFSLFFPPTIASFRRGDTEYAIGAIPAGGYVKITGMSAEELSELEPELRARAYYNQPPWKRIVVILAGPGVNLAIAFVIFAAVLASGSLAGDNTIGNIAPQVKTLVAGTEVAALAQGTSGLRLGDKIVTIDGRTATLATVKRAVSSDICAGRPESDCRGARPLVLGVERAGTRHSVTIYPFYSGDAGMIVGVDLNGNTVAAVLGGYPAAGILEVGDRILQADGRSVAAGSLTRQINTHLCAGKLVPGCRAASPVSLTIRRGGRRLVVALRPRYVAPHGSMEIGVALAAPRSFGLLGTLGASAATMWSLTESTVSGLAHAVTSAKARSHLSGIIGITQTTAEAVALGPAYGLVIIAFVSLILAVINLFPFLPLDGGHVLWSVVEKLRGARVSTQTMWKFSSVGIVFLIFLVFTGLSNNISTLAGG